MVQYCVIEWPKEPLGPHTFWPVFGSFEDCICQTLNTHVNSKEPFCQEESDYAGLWIRRTQCPFTDSIFALKADKKFEEEEQEKKKDNKREPLDNLPSPYPNNSPPVAVVSPAVPLLPLLPPPSVPE